MSRVFKGLRAFRAPGLAIGRNASMRGVGTKMGTVFWGNAREERWPTDSLRCGLRGATIIFNMRPVALALLGFSLLARAEDVKLDGIRSLLAPMRTDQTKGRKARGATATLTDVKHQLREWIESRLADLRWNGVRWAPNPKVLQEQLNDDLERAGLFCGLSVPCPEQTGLGFLGRVVIDIDRGVLVLRTAVGIDVCGDDESAYGYEWSEADKKWQRFWESEQDDYQEGKYFPQRLQDVQISPADFRPGVDRSEHLILTLGVEPWCSSNWHDVYYRVWQTKSSSAPVLLLDGKEWAFVDADIHGSVSRTDVLFQFPVSSVEGGFTRPEIRHYVLRRGSLERTDPVALSPRQFTSFWLARPPQEALRWTDGGSLPKLEEWRRLHKGPFSEYTIPTRHCTLHPDLWQVGTEEGEAGKQEAYFLVRWRPPYHFTMIAVGDKTWPDCTERDRQADEPGPLFPDR